MGKERLLQAAMLLLRTAIALHNALSNYIKDDSALIAVSDTCSKGQNAEPTLSFNGVRKRYTNTQKQPFKWN